VQLSMKEAMFINKLTMKTKIFQLNKEMNTDLKMELFTKVFGEEK